MAIKADTSNKADVQAMFKEANAFIEGEQVSILVNNAGITVKIPRPETQIKRSLKP